MSGEFDVQTDHGVITCRGRGRLRRGTDIPLAGDMVQITVEKGRGMVERILERKNHFIRPAVANVDMNYELVAALKRLLGEGNVALKE